VPAVPWLGPYRIYAAAVVMAHCTISIILYRYYGIVSFSCALVNYIWEILEMNCNFVVFSKNGKAAASISTLRPV
jgi:hypothetical protein